MSGFVASGDELVYLQRVATGDGHAQRLLANRLVVRVRRAAASFLPASVDAEDAAQHALIEILRAAHTYRADLSVERWADELAGRSILRFARAVRRRAQKPADEGVGEDLRRERATHGLPKFEALLVCLSEVRREALLLHHVYGYSIEQIAEFTHVPLALVRERIVAARRDIRLLNERTRGPNPALDRYMELRERELLADRFEPADAQECTALETSDLSVKALSTLFRELEMMLNQASLLRPTPADRDLVDQVLRAVRVTNTGGSRVAQRHDPDAELDRAVDPEGPAWIRGLAVSITTMLIIAAISALALFEPRSAATSSAEEIGVGQALPAVQVVALTNAHTATRGARIERGGKALPPGTDLREGDVLRAALGSGCIVVDPDVELCMGPASELRIASLSRVTRSVELLSGRIAGRLRTPSFGEPFTVLSGPLRASFEEAIFGVERVGESDLRVRILEGRALVRGDAWSSKLEAAQVGVFRAESDTLVIEPLPMPQANREWELIATGERPLPVKPAADPLVADSEQPVAQPAADETQAAEPTTESAETLLREGWELVKAKQWEDAIQAYQTLLRLHPKSNEAHVVLIRLGDLLLEHRNAPADALFAYERYLREGAGPLEQEARFGRIAALERLGREDAERVAVNEFLLRYPESAKAPALRERLKVLGGS